MLTIAIGDIHGTAGKLEALLRKIDAWFRERHESDAPRFIFLGDYIDRGPNSREVIERVRVLQEKGAVCLRGNHEELMIQSTESELGLLTFLSNGGAETMKSLQTIDAFYEARAWMETLPIFFEDELRYYVHAGVRPGVPLADQSQEDQLWIRDEFLRHPGPFPKYIVHGHTPTVLSDLRQTTPDIRPHRCNVDTGAGLGRRLSAVIFDRDQMKPGYSISA